MRARCIRLTEHKESMTTEPGAGVHQYKNKKGTSHVSQLKDERIHVSSIMPGMMEACGPMQFKPTFNSKATNAVVRQRVLW